MKRIEWAIDKLAIAAAGRTLAPVIMLPALAFVLFAAPAVAQQTGYLVLSPIDNGPAVVYIDGTRQGELSDVELTLRVTAGTRVVRVERSGFVPFTETVAVRQGDVVQLRVRMLESGIRVIEDDPRSGATRQRTTQVRVLHLEPVQVPIEVGGRQVGQTPATLSVPVGRHQIRIGGTTLCLVVEQGEDQLVRVRSGRIEELRGLQTCSEAAIPLVLLDVPEEIRDNPQAFVTIDGHRLPLGQITTLGSAISVRVPDPGQHLLAIEHPDYVPLAVDLRLEATDSVRVRLDLGSPRPHLEVSDTLAEPKKPEWRSPPPPDPPQRPSQGAYRAAESRLREGTARTLGVGGGAVLGLAGLVVGIASAAEPSSPPGVGWASFAAFLGGIYLSDKAAESYRACNSGCKRRARAAIASYHQQQASFPQRQREYEIALERYNTEVVPSYQQLYNQELERWQVEHDRWVEARRQQSSLAAQNQERVDRWRANVLRNRRDAVIERHFRRP